MIAIGIELFASVVNERCFEAKAVVNSNGIIVFPQTQQHRDVTAEGISYEDNYVGNALAVMIRPGAFEIRYHKAFTDRQVAEIVRAIAKEPGFESLAVWQITYQGRPVLIGDVSG